jgi:hypothetical protein
MNTIGTLSEKSIHSYIKSLLEKDNKYHEVRVGNYIADILHGNNVVEIQTQQFEKLLNKLDYYTQNSYNITVVYPLIHRKTINWIDPYSMEVVEQRKSSYIGVIQDVFPELYWIIDYIVREEIKFKIILLDVNEYKYLDGRGQNQKIKATKIDKVPTKIIEEIDFCSVSDLNKFIPETLENTWTLEQFRKETHSRSKYIGSGLKMLREVGVINVVGKKGRAYLYSVNKQHG